MILNPNLIRFYEVNGVKLPSVTSILQLCPDAPWITVWKNRIGEQGYKDYMRKLYDRGTAIHKVCENHFLGNHIEVPTDSELQKFITGFYTFLGHYGSRITPTDS